MSWTDNERQRYDYEMSGSYHSMGGEEYFEYMQESYSNEVAAVLFKAMKEIAKIRKDYVDILGDIECDNLEEEAWIHCR